MADLKKSRSKKTTQRQYEIMVDFIDNHRKMINGKLSQTFTAAQRDELWRQLAELLNSDGIGPTKTSLKWRRTWIDLKSEVKNRAAEHLTFRRLTGSGPAPPPLPILWEKILAMLDPVLIIGDENVKETGRTPENQMNLYIDPVPGPSQAEDVIVEDDDDTLVNSAVLATPRSSSTPLREHTNLPSVRKKNFGDLVVAESAKIEALNKIATAMERRNDLKSKELEILERQLLIQETRNGIFTTASTLVADIANAFLDKIKS